MIFDKEKYVVKNPNIGDTFITALRHDNVYALNTKEIAVQNFKCLKAITDDPKLWHRRLGHINTHSMQTRLNLPIVSVRSDHGKEFDQLSFDSFCKNYNP